MAQESLRIRALRARYFPEDIFAEYAWVLLLHGYLRHAEAPIGADGEALPPLDGQVMRHWCRYLEQQQLIVHRPVADGGPVLSDTGLKRMEAYLDMLAQAAAEIA